MPPATAGFRRATEEDAVQLARETFLADERVDMNALAARLGISRATLHRWVHTRENLLDRVLGQLTDEFLAEGLVQARARPDDAIGALTLALVSATSGFPPLRGFAAREPELSLRLLLGAQGAVRRRAVAGVRTLLAEAYAEEAGALEGFAETVVEVVVALEWATLIAGEEPSAERIAGVVRALLAGARAGELTRG
ncbi:MAG: QsdR family transcriptional regulator [Solirubrobacteraceae bacterium]|jgi:AcrR family transcriptional regulator|nr:QsdR family transcriptional regulator [Solirubrobacteraceae bacterium]MCU0314900.1 QsdR family transcriptional regulator [Solirubrobacteraceae bacterium]